MHRPRTRRCRWIPIGSALVPIVVGWWLLLTGAVVWLLAEPTASATPPPVVVAAGRGAQIHQPGMSHWPIPVSRAGFDLFHLGVQESDEGKMNEAFQVSEWIEARHGQAVRIVTVDGDAVEIELLEGPYSGRRAWLKARNLQPTR